jgi:uncharacterized protein (DUF1697 family)
VPRYVALLGSINVGGNRLKMADLKGALEAEGFENVTTVVASGNVLFEHKRAGDAALAKEIEAVVKDRFGIASFAAVRSRDEIEGAIAGNPFAKDGEAKCVHTLFLEEPLDRAAVKSFAAGYDGPERIAAGGRELFIDYAGEVARSQIDPALKKAKLIKSRATARNIRSLTRILDKLDS